MGEKIYNDKGEVIGEHITVDNDPLWKKVCEENQHKIEPEELELWCECDKEDDSKWEQSEYYEDGACDCGIHKHHYHCSCGGVLQIG